MGLTCHAELFVECLKGVLYLIAKCVSHLDDVVWCDTSVSVKKFRDPTVFLHGSVSSSYTGTTSARSDTHLAIRYKTPFKHSTNRLLTKSNQCPPHVPVVTSSIIPR